jgi:EAL domain-containing protein (putative c-di-GMP-specific phosphodiesterase class I)
MTAMSDLGASDLEAAIWHAVEHDELELQYQPIISLSTGEVAAHEALVRWHHPESGLRPPEEFIPAAEASDLICEVGAWVIDRAVRQVAGWNGIRNACRVVAVNVSGRHVNSARIRDDVVAALSRHEVGPDQLVLEITETVMVEDGAGLENLHELRGLGIALSLDDFGTGHNTDQQLSRLPVDVVKIDRSFLDIDTQSSRDVLRDMVERAHASGMAVVAEGVEQVEQLAALERLAVDFAQGFLIGRPMWPADMQD